MLQGGQQVTTLNLYIDRPPNADQEFENADQEFESLFNTTNSGIITEIVVMDASYINEPGTQTLVVYRVRLSFRGLAGEATLVSTFTASDGTKKVFRDTFYVVGIVLYERDESGEITILTGKNSDRFHIPSEGNSTVRTVKASIYEGAPPAKLAEKPLLRETITLIHHNGKDALPWSEDECGIAAEVDSLDDDTCSMAFSPDFTAFSVRVPQESKLNFEVTIYFRWPDIELYRQSAEQGVNGGRGTSIDNDVITTVRIADSTQIKDGQAGGALAPWKIAIIAIIAVLVTIAAVVLVCCLCPYKRSAGKPKPDVKQPSDKFHEQIGNKDRMTALDRGTMDEDDECYVEEPSSTEDMHVLMLENESEGKRRRGGTNRSTTRSSRHTATASFEPSWSDNNTVRSGEPLLPTLQDTVDGMVPLDRLQDKSVERLRLRSGVLKGIELESSTEGGSIARYGPPSDGDDVTTYGRGMTSVPRDHFRENTANRITSEEEEIAQRGRQQRQKDFRGGDYAHPNGRPHSERDGGAGESGGVMGRSMESNEESEGNGGGDRKNQANTRSKAGVGAAINRIRQVDLLHGPVTRGLVGRNGEPLEKESTRQQDADSLPVSVSTLS